MARYTLVMGLDDYSPDELALIAKLNPTNQRKLRLAHIALAKEFARIQCDELFVRQYLEYDAQKGDVNLITTIRARESIK